MTIKKNLETANNAPRYEVLEECGVVSQRKGGWELKLRYISWNGAAPKYDLRPWKVDENGNEICNKGLTLSGEELEALVAIING